MEENKKKSFHIFKDRSYLNDFKLNEQGKYQYQGDHYRWKEDRKKKMMYLILLASIQLVGHVIPGFIAEVKMEGHFYVVIPWAFALVFSIMQAWGIGRLYLAGEKVPSYVYKQTADKLPVRSMVAFLLSVMAGIGEVISLIQDPAQFKGLYFYPIFYVGLEMGAAICAYRVYRNPVQLEEIRRKQ